MAKIDRVENLPEWFDLDKYRGCESFGAAEWLHELTRRADLMKIHPDNLERIDDDDGVFHKVWLSVWKSTTEVHAAPVRQRPIDHQDSERDGSISMPIRAVRVFDLKMQAHRDEMAGREGICAPEKVNRWAAIGDPEFPIKEGVKLSRMPIEIDSYSAQIPPSPIILVNLCATDSVLIEAFNAWLREARANQPEVVSKRERPAYQDWARYGLLPYLDLRIWAMEIGSQIPHQVMAEAVGYRKGGDSFRKTVPKLADELMRSLAELEALAAIEAVSE